MSLPKNHVHIDIHVYGFHSVSVLQLANRARLRSVLLCVSSFRMSSCEVRLRAFLARYDELDQNLEKEDGFLKEFIVSLCQSS